VTRQFGRYSFLVALSALLALLVPIATQTTAQVAQGATMTVLAGQVAVIRANGAAIQPAPTGTEVFPGDEIRTLTNSGALITFFAGTEIELGNETVLVVESVSRPGDRVDVNLRQVAGTSVSRVHTLIDAGGGYRVEAGGAVALVRGSELGVLGPRDGIVVFINFESSVPILINQCVLMPGVGIWLQVEPDGRGGWRVVSDCHEFRADLRGGPWNALEEGFTLAQQDVQGDTKKRPAGQVPGGQVQEIRNELDKKKDDDNPPVTTTTTTEVGTTTSVQPAVTTTTTQPETVSSGTVTVTRGATETTTRTTTGTVTETTGASTTVFSTVTGTQTTTVPHTSVTTTTTTIPTTTTAVVTGLATTSTTTTVPETTTSTSTTSTTTTTTETSTDTTTSTTTLSETSTSTITVPSVTVSRVFTTTTFTNTVTASARLTTTSFSTTVVSTTTTTVFLF
jgi:hypothetical protein